METLLECCNNFSFKVLKVSVIVNVNEEIIEQGIMDKQGNKWVFNCNNMLGEYSYKYLINDCIRINDFSANIYIPDNKGELWSYLNINEKGEKLYNYESYLVNIKNYVLSSVITENKNYINRKSFNLNFDKKVVACFQFDVVTGVHSATAVWINPRGEIFSWSEQMLFKAKDIKNEDLILWFWINLNDNILEGKWTLNLFIDGEYILEDFFLISREYIYSIKNMKFQGGKY